MASAFQILPRAEIGEDKWDAFVDASDEAWLWHRYDLIEALSTWPTYRDVSFAIVDGQGALLAAIPLHRRTHVYLGLFSVVRLTSLGGPARAAHLSSSARTKVLSALHEHLQFLIAKNGALGLEVQVAPLSPWLHGPSAPKVNPLIVAGMENRQTETWMVDLAGTPEDIRKRYSELTRRELRKAAQSGLRLREAAGGRDIDLYYKLHLETYARTGAPAHPIDYFRMIFEKFQPRGLARILFAERRGEVVAAQNTGLYKGGAIYWTGASFSEKEGGENRLLFDAQIMAAREAGCTRYETGQAFVNSGDAKEAGLNRFKRSFGTELHPFYRGFMSSPRLALQILWRVYDMMQIMRRARA